jgi:hypothetical protein
MNLIILLGTSGKPALYKGIIDYSALTNKLALHNPGSFVPLDIYINLSKYMQEIL